MKACSLLLSFLFLVAHGLAQNPVPNPDFEDWTNGEPDQWITNNAPPQVFTISSTTDAHTGQYAAHGLVFNLGGTLYAPFLGSNNGAGTGFPVTLDYSTFQFWYKATLVGGDAFAVTMVMYDSSGTPIGSADIAITASVSSYVLLSLPVTYLPGTVPVTCIIQMIAHDPTGVSNGHDGTEFFVDDIELSGSVSLAGSPPPVNYLVYPNPANERVRVQLDNSVGRLNWVLSDAEGRIVDENSSPDPVPAHSFFDISIDRFPAGIYFLYLQSEGGTIRKRLVFY